MRHLQSRRGGAVCLAVAASLLVGAPGASARPSVNGPSATAAKRVPVLGSKSFAGPPGVGWGTYAPREIFNGGDPSGMVTAITWTGWGSPTAIGYGKSFIFKPAGGYYPGAVKVELRASVLGHCTAAGPRGVRASGGARAVSSGRAPGQVVLVERGEDALPFRVLSAGAGGEGRGCHRRGRSCVPLKPRCRCPERARWPR